MATTEEPPAKKAKRTRKRFSRLLDEEEIDNTVGQINCTLLGTEAAKVRFSRTVQPGHAVKNLSQIDFLRMRNEERNNKILFSFKKSK